MLKKNYSKTGRSCRVTFKVAADKFADKAASVVVCGEFNGWSQEAHPMKPRKDGTFSTTISLDAGNDYRFRYLLDGGSWRNDDAPDRVVPNRFGSYDSVVSV